MRLVILFVIAIYNTAVFAATDDWRLHLKNEQVEIYFKKSDCHDIVNGIHQEKILVKYINKTTEKLEISFLKAATYNGYTNTSAENSCTVVLAPNESREGICSDRDKSLTIFSKHLDMEGASLQAIDFRNMLIKTIR